MTRSTVRYAFLIAVLVLFEARAHANAAEAEVCAPANIGSAVGAEACFAVRLRAAETELLPLEARVAGAVVAASSDPASAKHLVEVEASAWRAYRDAKCELQGETDGGSAGWKTAMTTSCAVEESNAHIALLRKWLAGKYRLWPALHLRGDRMPDLPKPGAVLFAMNLTRLARFYEGVAGLSVVHADVDIIVLDAAQQQLILHGIPPHIAKTIVIGSPPLLRTDTAVKLVFAVTSIADARAKAAVLGGGVNAMENEFEARGFRACDGHDPEGNVIQFRERVV